MMKTHRLFYAFLVMVLAFSLTACGGSSAEKEAEQEEENGGISINVDSDSGEDVSININTDDLEKGMEELQKNLNKLTDGKMVEPVDFRSLKELLPSEVAGLELTDSEGQKSGVAGFKVSSAQGTYEEGNKEIKISILDTGGFAGALMGMAAWSQIEVDKENKDGYERTTTINGHKAFEKYDNNREKGQVAIIVGDRYLVSIEGDNVSERDLKKALESIELDELSDLVE